jgi:hypothetical protein
MRVLGGERGDAGAYKCVCLLCEGKRELSSKFVWVAWKVVLVGTFVVRCCMLLLLLLLLLLYIVCCTYVVCCMLLLLLLLY